MNGRITIYFLIWCFLSGLNGQDTTRDFENELGTQDEAIESLKRQIRETKARIEQAEQQEKSTADKIFQMDKEISLTEQLINKLNREKRTAQQRLSKLEREIPETEAELSALRSRYVQRAVRSYKKGTLSSLVSILSSSSWRQAVYRTEYLQIISSIERELQAAIRETITKIKDQKSQQQVALERIQTLDNEQRRQRSALQRSKSSKQQELEEIRKDKSELAKYMDEKQEGLQQLEEIRKQILADKERFERAEKIRLQQEALNAKSFAELKGQLPWPVAGSIITRFGRQSNPELNTTTDNPGIDIRGVSGAEVRAILNGIVTTITFIRGYGTTIIIDHGGGFYTVYSHVTDLNIHVDSEVRGGDTIAYLGSADSVNGARLHFEIWGQNQKLDPEIWLNK
jgi:septal ring factor EnvC (AmiA/AmiB activator)